MLYYQCIGNCQVKRGADTEYDWHPVGVSEAAAGDQLRTSQASPHVSTEGGTGATLGGKIKGDESLYEQPFTTSTGSRFFCWYPCFLKTSIMFSNDSCRKTF